MNHDRMEHIIIKNKQGKILRGDLHKVNSDKIIIISHGFVSDRHAGGRFDKTAIALNKKGFDVLAFDYSGCGESNKSLISVKQWTDDLSSVIKFVKKSGYKRIGILGASLGGTIAVNCGADCMVLWAPVTNKEIPKITEEQKREMKKGHYIYIRNDNGIRFMISKKYYDERVSMDQKGFLRKIVYPVLILHGTKDKSVPLDDSIYAAKHNGNIEFKMIKGADHKFILHIYKAIGYTESFFRKYL